MSTHAGSDTSIEVPYIGGPLDGVRSVPLVDGSPQNAACLAYIQRTPDGSRINLAPAWGKYLKTHHADTGWIFLWMEGSGEVPPEGTTFPK